jgi:hypothetical protein
MPRARIHRAANTATEPSHSLNGGRTLQNSASHRHRLLACHLTQPNAAEYEYGGLNHVRIAAT